MPNFEYEGAGTAGFFGLGGAQTSSGAASVGGAVASGGAAAAGGNFGTGGSSIPSGAVCAHPVVITNPAIADFETYNGVADLSNWYANLGGDASTGVLVGTFGYGDHEGTDSTGAARTDLPQTFDMVAGYGNSKYALRIADTLALNYGGGQGLWLSACLSATKFTGISLWVRGNCPKGYATLTLSMQETTPSKPTTVGGAYGTCPGTSATCVHPKCVFPVTDTWTLIQIPWSKFTAGSAVGAKVMPDGRNITQLQLGIDLLWVLADGGDAPVPAPYELVVDNWAFY